MHKLKETIFLHIHVDVSDIDECQKNLVMNVMQTRIATIWKDPTPVNVARDTLGTAKYAQVNSSNLFRFIISNRRYSFVCLREKRCV